MHWQRKGARYKRKACNCPKKMQKEPSLKGSTVIHGEDREAITRDSIQKLGRKEYHHLPFPNYEAISITLNTPDCPGLWIPGPDSPSHSPILSTVCCPEESGLAR
jgi:hypothetical protein